ncbi:flagellar export chaperone FliS [Domibacillus epiphyticus]|uniref:Flagellar export chaperone FliS n=1 Tax=Domibacillus epiphyticus TaxID=1714355 RepID=A0A1V2A483_9BACI|nr:flagellar export chaperone FliS [Domibacillus epiphyticus]OMP65808.1 flagellar export chaperone FliS [Domibacillus epiphyticus]
MDFITKEMIYQKTPQQITALLYEAGLEQFSKASACLQEGKLVEANLAMQRINDIVERLGAGINYEAGIIADQLDQVYNFIADTVIQANLNKDNVKLSDAQRLFETLAEAWNEAMKTAPAKVPVKRKQNAYEQNIFVEDLPTNSLETGK